MQIEDLTSGDRVSLIGNKKTLIYGTFSHADPNGKAYIHGDDGISYRKIVQNITLLHPVPKLFEPPKVEQKEMSVKERASEIIKKSAIQPTKKPKVFTTEKMQKYDINQRFDFLESFVRMVGNGFRNSLVITGKGGLGKSHTIEQEFNALGLVPYCNDTGEGDYKVIKGTSTARGYFNTLRKYNNIILIFDDCKKVLLDPVIIEISKGALDTKKNRSVCWVTVNGEEEFEYTGRVIYLANLDHSQLDEAFKTRASVIDVSMTPDEMISRIRFISSKEGYRTDISSELKEEAIKIIEENKHCKKLSIRTFLEAMDYIASGEENWRDLLIYSMT